MLKTSQPPPFHHSSRLSDRFDMRSFAGRLQYNWARMNPLCLRWGAEEVDRANKTLADFRAGTPGIPDTALWHALRVREASCGPDGELLPWFFRSCGWALGGTPGIAFMTVAAVRWPTSLAAVAFGQWANQTHLAGCTYSNRGSTGNRGGADTGWHLLRAYAIACATAVPVAFGAAVLAKRFARPLQPLAPYPGVAAANAMGCVAMRQAHLEHGVPVIPVLPPGPGSDAGGSAGGAGALGESPAAGWVAVRDTAVTRVVLPMGNFLGVPLILGSLTRLRGARPPLAVQIAVTATVFSLWLPVGAAVYPPTGRLPLSELEPHLVLRAPPGCSEVEYQRGV